MMKTRLRDKIISGLSALAMLSACLTPGIHTIAAGTPVHSFDTFSLTFKNGAVPTEITASKEWDVDTSSWISGTANTGYVWNAETSQNDHAFIYNLHIVTSGDETIPVGQLEIQIPLHILRSSSGVYADEIELSIPSKEVYLANPDGTNIDNIYFYYTVDESSGKVVIKNVKEIESGFTLDIPFQYSTTKSTWEYQDMGKSDACTATGIIHSHDNLGEATEANGYSDSEAVYIDTHVNVKSTTKRMTSKDIYYTWYPDWGSNPDPDNDTPFVYFVWTIQSTIGDDYAQQFNSGEITQGYSFSLHDVFNGLVSIDDEKYTGSVTGDIVAYKYQGTNWVTVAPESSDTEFPAVTGLTEKNGLSRTDYVIVRYPKSEINEVGVKYGLSNSEIVTVTPNGGIDAQTTAQSLDNIYLYTPPKYQDPVATADMKKYGVVTTSDIAVTNSNMVSSYALADYREGTDISGFRYYVESDAFEYPSTYDSEKELSHSASDIENYEKENVTYTLTDETLSVTDLKTLNVISLTDDDYYFTALDYDIIISPGTFDENTQSYKPSIFESGETAIVYYYVRAPGETDYHSEPVASYDVAAKQYTILDSSYVAAMNDKTVQFAQEIAGWKLESTNPYFRTKFAVKPTVTLRSTDRIVNEIDTSSNRIGLNNTADFAMYDYNGTLIDSMSRTGTDYAAEVERFSSISKRFVPTDENDIMNGQYKATWMIEVSETQRDNYGETPVKQVGGTFYDILPIVSTTKADLIELYADSKDSTPLTAGDAESGDYWIEFQSVTDNLGYDRVKLVVHIHDTVSASKYFLKVRTIHTHEDILDYGRNIMNSVAYEKGNGEIADGYPDSGGTVSESYLLRDLDPDTDDKKFLYAQATHYIPALLFNSAGISKTVSSDMTQPAQRTAIVAPDSDYTYTIRLKNSSANSSKDIVVLDSIENFCIQNGVRLNGSDAFNLVKDWAGTPVGFGTGNLDYKGVAYQIYLTDTPNLDLTSYNSYIGDNFIEKVLTDTSWKRIEEFGDIANATAFMIDMRKKTDGTDFVMSAGESLSFTLRMHSPDAEPVTVDGIYPGETYNNIFNYQFSFTEITGTTPSGDPIYDAAAGYSYKHQDYTTVSYRVFGDMKFKKIDSETKEPISGLQFNLKGTSIYGTEVNKNFVTGSTGVVTCTNLERGTYILTETTDPSVDYQRGDARTVTVDASGNVTITPNDRTSADADVTPVGYPLIKNDYRVHGDLHFMKVDADSLAILSNAEFTLTTQGNQKGNVTDYGNPYSATVVSTGAGVAFENIELGTYILTETAYPKGYAPVKKSYTVTVSEVGRKSVITISGDDVSKVQGEYQLKNTKLTEMRIVKYDNVNKTEYLGGAEFQLSPTASTLAKLDISQINTDVWETTSFIQTKKTDINGVAVFTEILKDGEYILKETKAPDNHKLTAGATEYTVIVEDGVIKILDSQNEAVPSEVVDPTGLEFHLYNERTYDGEVVAVKKWVGDPLTYGSAFPELTFSTKEQKLERKYATIDRLEFTRAVWTDSNANKRSITNGATSFNRLDLDAAYADCKTIEDVVEEMNKNGIAVAVSDFKEVQINRENRANKNDYAHYTNSNDANSGRTSYNKFGTTVSGFRDCSDETGKIFIYRSEDTSYFWSDANVIYMPIDSELLFDAYKGTDALDLTNFYSDYTAVMVGTFFNCENITSITGLEKFRTSNVVVFGENRGMFQGCKKITSLDLSDFDFTKAVNLKQMFNQCYVLENIAFPATVDATNVTSMQSMFLDCHKLSTVNFSNWTTSSALKSLNQTFRAMGDTSANDTTIYFGSNFVTSGVTNMEDTFRQVTKIKNLDISNFDFSNATTLAAMFYQCRALENLSLPASIDATKVTSMMNLFAECYKLGDLDFSSCRTSSALTNMERMFFSSGSSYTGPTRTITFGSTFDTSGVTNMKAVFDANKTLTSIIGLHYFNTQNVSTFEGMFYNVQNLEKIDLSSFVTKDGADVKNFFRICNKLKTVYANSNYWTNINQTGTDTFNGTTKIVGGNGTTHNASNTGSAYARVDGSESQPGYFTDYTTSGSYETDFPDGYNYWESKKTGTSGHLPVVQQVSYRPPVLNAPAVVSPSVVMAKAGEETEQVSVTYKTSKTPVGSLITDDTGSYYEVIETIKLSNGETQTEKARWYRNSDSEWVCYVKVYNPKSTYYVSEEELSGYTSGAYLSSTNPTGLVMDTGSITIKNTKKNAEKPKTGSLRLHKAVTDGTDLHVRKSVSDVFRFTVTLYAPTDSAAPDKTFGGNGYNRLTGKVHYGSYEFVDGVANVTLSAEGIAIISDIPENYVYTIEEAALSGYSQGSIILNPTDITAETGGTSYATQAAFNAAGQTIDADGTDVVLWNNQIEKANLSVAKTFIHQVDGVPQTLTTSEANKEFSFTVMLNGLIGGKHYDYTGGGFDATASGTITLDNIKIKHGETVVFEDLPVNTGFTITEVQIDGIVTEVDGLSGNTSTGMLTSTGQTVQFTNTLTTEQTVEVNVIKNWVGDSETDRPSEITISLYQGIEGSLDGSQFVQEGSLDAEHSWQTQFTGLPAKNSLGQYYVYSVIEGDVDGYTGAVSSTTDTAHNVEVTITNTKDTATYYSFSLEKHVTGNLGSKSKQFLFTVTLQDDAGHPINGFKNVEKNGDANPILTLFDVNGKTTISLSDGDSAAILNLPEGTKVSVVEADYSGLGYSKSAVYTIDGVSDSYTDGNILVLTDDAEVVYTNHSEGSIPTGVDMQIRYIIPLGLFFLGGLAVSKKRKKTA